MYSCVLTHSQNSGMFTECHAEVHDTELHVGVKASTLPSSNGRVKGLVGMIGATRRCPQSDPNHNSTVESTVFLSIGLVFDSDTCRQYRLWKP